MFSYLLISHFLFGLIIGSFLNVVIIRHNTGRSLAGRSGCVSCQAKLKAHQLVPVVSWVWQMGRCAACGSRISLLYPIVEMAAALSFVGIYLLGFPLFLHILALGIMCLAVLITAYDIRHTIIPDAWSYGFAGLTFVFAAGSASFSMPLLAWGELIVAGPVVAAPLAAMWLFSGGRWMGLGDAKLALGIGWLLGIVQGYVAVMGAFVIGAVIGLTLLAVSSPSFMRTMRRLTPIYASRKLQFGFTIKSEVPFGPFLLASCFLVWFLSQYGFYMFVW